MKLPKCRAWAPSRGRNRQQRAVLWELRFFICVLSLNGALCEAEREVGAWTREGVKQELDRETIRTLCDQILSMSGVADSLSLPLQKS